MNFRPMRDSVYGVIDAITGASAKAGPEGVEHGFFIRFIVTVGCLIFGILAAKYIPGLMTVLDIFGRRFILFLVVVSSTLWSQDAFLKNCIYCFVHHEV